MASSSAMRCSTSRRIPQPKILRDQLSAAAHSPRESSVHQFGLFRRRVWSGRPGGHGRRLSGAGADRAVSRIDCFRAGIYCFGIVIFGRWHPGKAALAALVFGACDALQLSLQLGGANVPSQLLASLPYIVTILAISGLFGGKAIQPAALMMPYFKD